MLGFVECVSHLMDIQWSIGALCKDKAEGELRMVTRGKPIHRLQAQYEQEYYAPAPACVFLVLLSIFG